MKLRDAIFHYLEFGAVAYELFIGVRKQKEPPSKLQANQVARTKRAALKAAKEAPVVATSPWANPFNQGKESGVD